MTLVIVLTATLGVSLQAQDTANTSGKIPIREADYQNSQIPMADAMREDGKIYVVVATLSAIMIGLFGYLFVMERRISRLEKEQ